MTNNPDARVRWLKKLDLSKSEILNLDSSIFSDEDKQALIELIYGHHVNGSWQSELESAFFSLHRWNRILNIPQKTGKPYRVGSNNLLAKAELLLSILPPERLTSNTVTAFTNWIFRLYIPERSQDSLRLGQLYERQVAISRIPIPQHSQWKLIYNGMSDADSDPLAISELSIDGHTMHGKPDLVFREKNTNRILIIEIKVSEADIPLDGWPNLRAQLWAYSKIDKWRDIPEILLVGEVWGYRSGLRVREAIQYKKNDPLFENECERLFELYRNYHEGLNSKPQKQSNN